MLLLAACIATPILVITVLFVQDVERLTVAARAEAAGTAHIRALVRVFEDASTYRSAAACGRALGPVTSIERDIAALNELERRNRYSAGAWEAAVAAWRRGGTPFARADAFVSRISPLFVAVADRSGVIYDHEVGGVDLADALTYRLPRAVEDLQRIELQFCTGAALGAGGPVALARLSGSASSSLDDAYADIDEASEDDPTLPSTVVRRRRLASRATDATFARLARFESERSVPLARPAARDTAKANRALFDLIDVAGPGLDRIIDRRIAYLRNRYEITLVPGIIAMLAAGLFVLLGARSVLQRAEISRVRRTAEELEFHAQHDSLTRLPNRAAFVTSLQETLATSSHSGDAATVLFIDLDNFKLVNDSLGHAAGDRVLCAVSDRLRMICHDGKGKIVARFGGDEFTMLVHDAQAATLAERVDRIVARIRDDLVQPVLLDATQDIVVTASVGIATLEDVARSDAQADDLLRDADVAMYEAKARGRARAATFGPAMHERAVRKLQLTNDLRGAAARSEFILAYEPIVRLSDGTRSGCESLIRWQHPTLGLLLPGAFLSIAEESGAIVQIGRWVLQNALADLSSRGDRFVHVNLSVRDLMEETLLNTVCALLAGAKLPPRSLSIEITEGSLVRSGGRAEAMLERLRALGVRIWIDDFGVEYSSLRYLDRLPVDGVKIDRSFVGGADGRLASPSIVKMVLELAASFGLDVVAEGIETVEQRDELIQLGCVYGQGYLYTRTGGGALGAPPGSRPRRAAPLARL